MAWNQPIEAIATSVRQYPRTPAAGSTVTTELATINDDNPCGDRGLDAVCPSVAIDGTDGEKLRRRESNPRVQSRNSQVAQRLWNVLQDVGVSWEWNDDANRQPMALDHEELAEVITNCGCPLCCR